METGGNGSKEGIKRMNNIKWIKISCDFFDDEAIKIIEQMPDGDSIIVIWLKLLISAGKINDKGFIYFKKEIPYTDEMLSTVFNRPLNTIRLAIQTFERFGMIQITNEQQIFVSNWEKHQNVEGMERVKEQTRERVKKFREKEKQKLLPSNVTCNVTVTQSNATEQEQEQEQEQEKEKELDNTHTLKTENEKSSCVCVELTKEEKQILVKYAKKSNARNIDAYINTLIQKGAHVEIIKNALEAEEKRRQREIEQRPQKIEISDEERAEVAEKIKKIRENFQKTGYFVWEQGEQCN